MANARQLIASRTTISTVPAEMEMTANELLEIMCANSSDNKASLYNDNIESVSPGLFWNAISPTAGNNNWLEEVVLPNCTSVAFRTFYRCSALKRLILPALTSCSYASSFQYLSSIEELDIGNVVSTGPISLTGANVNGFTIYIGDGYYVGGSSATAGLLTIPSTVTGPVKIVFNGSKVGNKVLRGSTHQVDVEILDSVTSIGDYCFDRCTGLTSVTIPNSITSIGSYCFKECTGLTSVTIPDSVISAGIHCFYGCTGLTSAGPIGGDYDCKFGWRNEIPANVFYGCTGLTQVTIPESVTSLGDSCFNGCTGLTSVTIPNSVTVLGGSCFNGCTGLTSVTIPNSVTVLGGSCFRDCTGLTQVTIPESVTSIGVGCFANCTSRIDLYGTTGRRSSSSDSDVFGSCEVHIYGESIEEDSFSHITSSFSAIIESSVTSLGMLCFSYCTGLTSVTIPESVTSIGTNCFLGCTGLTSAGPIGGDYNYKFGWINSIPSHAFLNLQALTSVTIPESVTSLGTNCFYGCTGLMSVTLPKNITSLGATCFGKCTGLTAITSLAIVPPTTGGSCFSQVDKSIPVYVPAGSVAAYQAATGWSEFTNIQAIPETT